jgi:hypothetical protein
MSSGLQHSRGVSIQVDEPPVVPKLTNVKGGSPTGSSPPGSICACGIATKDNVQLVSVWAAVINLLGGQNPPNSHTAGATKCNALSGENWDFVGSNLVLNVPCANAPVQQANFTFVVWFSFADDNGVEHPKAVDIAAVCASSTNCDGTSNRCAKGHPLSPSGRATTVAVETAPRQYRVQGQGARGPLASAANKTWALNLRTGGCGCTFAWDNEGDGVRVPRVVLRPDGLISTEWNLTVVLNGRRAIYTCPAPEWNALGANRVPRTSGDDSLPEVLIVRPV